MDNRMTMIELTARRIEVDEMSDWDTYVLSLAENEDASGWQLIFSLPLHPGEQDVALGQATYAITTHEGITHYGGVQNWRREGNQFQFWLNKKASEALGLDDELSISVPNRDNAELVENALGRIVGKS